MKLADEQHQTQLDIQRAFEWVTAVSREAAAMLDDAARLFVERGFEAAGEITAYGPRLTSEDGPFVQYSERAFRDPANAPHAGVVLGVALHHVGRTDGPRLICAAVETTGEEPDFTWITFYAAAFHDRRGRFAVTGNEIKTSVPIEHGKRRHPHVTRVRWFELPLAWVTGSQQLEAAVRAACALREGREDDARALLAGS